MRVVLSTLGKFHTFDLARELHRRHMLTCVFTGYPHFKLRNEGLPRSLMKTWPWLHAPYMAFPWRDRLAPALDRHWVHAHRVTFDEHVAAHLPPCDVFVGLSSGAVKSGRVARSRGARHVCDRGSSHILIQEQLLREEHERWGIRHEAMDPRTVEREQAEYQCADLITVPSTFNLRTFVQAGVPAHKVKVVPYGVNLDLFHAVAEPDPARFDLLFVGAMGWRKGVADLLQAFAQLKHARKSLTFAGMPSADFMAQMKRRDLWQGDIRVLGHVPQPQLKALMSVSHALVLPSIEEGLALVQAQAMACGCPVIGSHNSGAEDLFDDGQEGYIVPIRRPDLIAERLGAWAEDPALRLRMSQAGVQRVRQMGGWSAYGDAVTQAYANLCDKVAA
jgi:glycosyltransferase involved in cell wall biosynthesis